ncbi:hypothetical protein BH23BAC3_BH23BAC3_02260 [soil metagenome]
MKILQSDSTTILDRQMGFALLRFILGINMPGRSIVRIPELSSFAGGMVDNFADTFPFRFIRIHLRICDCVFRNGNRRAVNPGLENTRGTRRDGSFADYARLWYDLAAKLWHRGQYYDLCHRRGFSAIQYTI